MPKQSKHPKEAYELAKFLTSPQGQVGAFKEAGPLPSSPQALDDPAFLALKNDYFSNAPVGADLRHRCEGPAAGLLGPKHQAVRTRLEPAMQAVEQGKLTPEQAWAQAQRDATKEAKL